MAIFRLSVPQIPDGRNQTLIPSKNIVGKLLLGGGCVKWMFMDRRNEETHSHPFADLEAFVKARELLISLCFLI